MTLFALIGILAVHLVLMLLFGYMAWNAPDGWEDDDGFHYGQRQ